MHITYVHTSGRTRQSVYTHEKHNKGTNTRSVSVHGIGGVWSLETSDSKYLWNIGTEANPIIQGQAGKPFWNGIQTEASQVVL